MEKLTIAEAKRINDTMVSEAHLKLHAANVAACMGAMAAHFGEDREHWEAVGYLHDYDYEKFPEEHLLQSRASHGKVHKPTALAHIFCHYIRNDLITSLRKPCLIADIGKHKLVARIGNCLRIDLLKALLQNLARTLLISLSE